MAEKFIGPVMPSTFTEGEKTEGNSTSGNYGPALPPHLMKKRENPVEDEEESHSADVIGPILPGSSASSSAAQEALEERSQELKYKFLLGVSSL